MYAGFSCISIAFMADMFGLVPMAASTTSSWHPLYGQFGAGSSIFLTFLVASGGLYVMVANTTSSWYSSTGQFDGDLPIDDSEVDKGFSEDENIPLDESFGVSNSLRCL